MHAKPLFNVFQTFFYYREEMIKNKIRFGQEEVPLIQSVSNSRHMHWNIICHYVLLNINLINLIYWTTNWDCKIVNTRQCVNKNIAELIISYQLEPLIALMKVKQIFPLLIQYSFFWLVI